MSTFDFVEALLFQQFVSELLQPVVMSLFFLRRTDGTVAVHLPFGAVITGNDLGDYVVEGESLKSALAKCTKPEIQTLFEEYLAPVDQLPKKTPKDELVDGFVEAWSVKLERDRFEEMVFVQSAQAGRGCRLDDFVTIRYMVRDGRRPEKTFVGDQNWELKVTPSLVVPLKLGVTVRELLASDEFFLTNFAPFGLGEAFWMESYTGNDDDFIPLTADTTIVDGGVILIDYDESDKDKHTEDAEHNSEDAEHNSEDAEDKHGDHTEDGNNEPESEGDDFEPRSCDNAKAPATVEVRVYRDKYFWKPDDPERIPLEFNMDRHTTTIRDVMDAIFTLKGTKPEQYYLVHDGKKCAHYRRLVEYSGAELSVRFYVKPKLQGGGLKKSIVKKKCEKNSIVDRTIYESGYTTAIAIDTAKTFSLTDGLKQMDATALDTLQEFLMKDKSTHESKLKNLYMHLGAYQALEKNIQKATTAQETLRALVDAEIVSKFGGMTNKEALEAIKADVMELVVLKKHSQSSNLGTEMKD